MKEGNETGVTGNPRSLDERVILATQCVSQYKFTMPMVIDRMDGKVNSDYEAAPVRVTVVDIDGKVAFYAGRGPADFRIPPVERTIKKLIANGGRMPPLPPMQWGEPVNGLRCGLSIDPNKPAAGEQIVARVAFRNMSEALLVLPCDPTEMPGCITITSGDGRQLKIDPLVPDDQRRPRRADLRRIGQQIAPGQAFEVEVEGRIMEASSETLPPAEGSFRAFCQFVVRAEAATGMKPAARHKVWTGKIASGVCTLHIAPRQ